MIFTVSQRKDEWCTFTPLKGFSKFDPEEVHSFFIDLISSDNDDDYIYIRKLDDYCIDIIRVIHIYGFMDVTREGYSEKKMPSKSYSYMISEDGRCFAVTVKIGKTVKRFRSFELLIPIKKEEELLELYPSKLFGLEAVCSSMMDAIIDIGGLSGDGELPLTISSLSYKVWRDSYVSYDFFSMFRRAEKIIVHDMTLDDYVRPSYHGGWCYINYDKKRRYEKSKGCTLDVNSLYPYVMENCPLPYGEPIEFKGDIPKKVWKVYKKGFCYFYVRVKCRFDLKVGHFPCIQGTGILYGTDWLETSDVLGKNHTKYDSPVLTLTCTDYELLLEHYEVRDLEILDGVYFKASCLLYHNFVERFYTMKKKSKTPGQRKIAKMILNSLSGNMSKKRVRKNLIIDPTKDGNEIFVGSVEQEVKSMSHIHIGSAITAYARAFIIRYAHKYKNFFCYSDTDSLHLDTDFRALDIPIGEELGAFKVEAEWTDAIFFTKKIYAERGPHHVAFKCAGLDSEISEMVIEMLKNGHPKRPEGVDELYFRELRVKLILGIEQLEKVKLPYTEKVFHDFTYDTYFNELKLNFEQKQKKTAFKM